MMQRHDAFALPERRKRLVILACLWGAIAAVFLVFRSVVMPFAGAALIAYLVQPLVARITQLRVAGRAVPHWAAILLIYALFFVGVYLFLIALVPQLYRELARISGDGVAFVNSLTPEYLQSLAHRLEGRLGGYGIPAVDLEQLLNDSVARLSVLVRENLGNIVGVSRNIIAAVLTGIFGLFFMLMVAAFFSIDALHIRRYFGTLIPPEYAADARALLERIDRSLAGVVRGQATICVVNGILTAIGLLVFGVKFAFLLATIATLFSLIPIFGTIISSVPIVLIALADGFQKGLAILLWIIGIHALEAYFLNPKIMGQAARIHPVLVAFSLIAGERLYGLVGALFAVPIAALFVACFDFARTKAQPTPAEVPAPAPELAPAVQPAAPPAP
jgi:putative heme transporter